MLKTWRRLSLKSKLLLAGLILVLALFIRFQIYFHGDYRDKRGRQLFAGGFHF